MAELMEIPTAIVPDSLAAYRAYFAAVLPRLRSIPDAQATIDFVRRPKLPGQALHASFAPALRVLGFAATALVPRSLRALAGLPDWDPRTLPAAAGVVPPRAP